MIIEKLQVKNFKSIGDISLNFPRNGLIVIDGINHDTDGGSNASGKTSLVSAIPFCFFGKVFDGGNLADYVRVGEDNLYVACSLKLRRGRLFLERTLTDFSLYRNGEKLEATKTSLTKEFSYLTGLSYPALKALFLGQSWESFVDATPARRVEALEDIFSLFLFEEAIKRFKKQITDYDKKLRELENKKSHLEGILVSNKESFDYKIEEFEERRRNLLAKIDSNLLKLDQQLALYRKQRAELQVDNADLDTLQEYLGALQKEYSKVTSDLKVLVERKKAIEREKKSVSSRIKTLRYELERLSQNICPVCGQTISNPQLISSRKKELEELLIKLDELKQELDKIAYRYTLYLSKAKELATDIQKKKVQYDQLKLTASKIIEIESYIDQLETKKESLLKERERLLSEENPFIKLERERKRKFDSAMKRLSSVNKKIDSLNQDISFCNEWIDITKKVRAFLFSEMLQFLTAKANEYLFFLYPELQVKFTHKKAKLLISVFKNGKEWVFKLLSGGEQQLVRLSCLLGLFEAVRVRVTEPINFLFLDEPFHNLDLNKREKVLSLLKGLSKDLQIFVIDHSQSIGSDVDYYILLEKKGGITSIST